MAPGGSLPSQHLFSDVHSFLQNISAELSRVREQIDNNEMRHMANCDQIRRELEQERLDSRESTNKFRYEFDDLVQKRVETVLDGLEEMEQSQKYKDRAQQHQLDSLETELHAVKSCLGGVNGPWSRFRAKCNNRQPLRRESSYKVVKRKKPARKNMMQELMHHQQVEAVKQMHELVETIRHRVKAAAIYIRGEDWGQVFREQDKDGSGQINFDEFLAMARDELKIQEQESKFRLVFDSLDMDGSGDVSIEELIEFVSDPLIRMRSRLKQAVKQKGGSDWAALLREQDTDGSGHLGYEEFHIMCRNVLKLLDKEVHLRAVFMLLDADSSGEISIEELVQWVDQQR